MNVLVVGAGVIGTIYGGRLAEAGNDVTMLARGERLRQLTSDGLVLEDIRSGRRSETRVRAIGEVSLQMRSDLVIVAVRDRQLPAILPVLDALAGAPEILFLLNCPLRVDEIIERFGREHVQFGFPGVGGVRVGAVVRYTAVGQQPTTFGPVAGQDVARSRRLAKLFKSAGFATSVVGDMDAWLKTHAFLIAAICGALYKNGGRSARLAQDMDGLALLRRGVREGFRCIRSLGFTPSPTKLRLLATYVPERLLLRSLRKFFSSKLAEFAIDGHATAAPEDMQDLANDCRSMIGMSGVEAPTMQRLCAYVDEYVSAAARRELAIPAAS